MEIEFRTSPFITDDSFFFLEKYLSNKSSCSVLEFGAGASTIWLDACDKVSEVTSIEHDKIYYDAVLQRATKKTVLLLRERPYNTVCNSLDQKFDIIIIDGRDRNRCFESSLPLLKEDGIIIFDNMERGYYHKSYDLWYKNNLGQILSFEQVGADRCGFDYSPKKWITSVFIKNS